MSCTKLSYNNVTPAAWKCVVQFAASHGVHVTTNKGQASKDGFTVQWDYNPTAQTASVQCIKKIFIIPCKTVDNFINTHAHDCLAAHNVVMEPMFDE